MWNDNDGAGEPKRRGRPKKNPDLPGIKGQGVELPSIPAIDDAIEEYVKWRDKRMACTPKEVETKAALLRLMKKHKVETYSHDELVATIVPEEETVKVKKARVADDGEGEE